MGRPKYFKIDPFDWLTSAKLNTLGLEYRGAWANLLAFAKICNCNGQYLDEFLEPCDQLEIVRKSKVSMVHFSKFLVADMIVQESDGKGRPLFKVKNWLLYQDEYDRTKPYYLQKLDKALKDKNKNMEKEYGVGVGEINARISTKDSTPNSTPPKPSKYGKSVIRPQTA